MEPTSNSPQGQGPHRPGFDNAGQPVRPRPLMNDFGPRPHAAPGPNPALRRTMDGFSTGPNPQASAAPRPAQPQPRPPVRPTQSPSVFRSAPSVSPPPSQSEATAREQPEAVSPLRPYQHKPDERAKAAQGKHRKHKEPNERKHTGRAGLAGLITFLVLAVLLLSPFIPGKILDNFPGSSQSLSVGDSSLSCIDDLGPAKTTNTYDIKLGSPIVYKYSTTTKQTAACDNTSQTAVTGHSSQFNPLGLLVDLAIVVGVAFAVTTVWRRIFGRND